MRPKRPPQLCDTPDCEDQARTMGLCDACYHWEYYHKKQPLKRTLAYRQKMARIQRRIERTYIGRRNGIRDIKTRHRNNMPVSESSGIN